ncbi:MAG: DUF3237 domain-containing protein, partial [Syntrophales bacterium]
MKGWIIVTSVLLAIAVPGICMAQATPATVADTKGFEPPKPKLEYLGRWSVDLIAPIWELGQTSDL